MRSSGPNRPAPPPLLDESLRVLVGEVCAPMRNDPALEMLNLLGEVLLSPFEDEVEGRPGEPGELFEAEVDELRIELNHPPIRPELDGARAAD